MPHILTQSRDNPEFARVVEVARLADGASLEFDLRPEPEEAAAIARLLGAVSVRKMRFAGALHPMEEGPGWRLEATLGATAVQPCVVSLDPVTTRIDQPVRRRFLPKAAPRCAEVEITAADDDEVEPLGARIDLGLVAIEALALALPDYPRRPGVTLERVAVAPEGVTPIRDVDVKPFAPLAALRDKMSGGS